MRTILKSRAAWAAAALTMALFAGILAGCDNPVDARNTPASTTGRVQLVINPQAARTLLPAAPAFTKYELSVQKKTEDGSADDGAAVTSAITEAAAVSAGTASLDLAVGKYVLTVTGYNGANVAARGESALFTVSSGAPTPVAVTLSLVEDEGPGTLKYTVTIAAGLTASLSIQTIIAPITLTSGNTTNDSVSLTVGDYLVDLTVSKSGSETRIFTEVAQIYSNVETLFEISIPADYLTFNPLTGSVAITGTAKVGEVLTATPTGDAATAPIYEWQRGDAAGGPFTAIAGAADAAAYTLQTADLGKYVRAAVRRADRIGTKYSAPTAAIIAIDISALETAIDAAADAADPDPAKGNFTVSADGAAVLPSNKWVTQAELDAFTDEITTAEGVKASPQTQAAVDNAASTLEGATTTFNTTTKKAGLLGISLGAITDITAPVHGAASTTADITATAQYTGAFVWTGGLTGGTSGNYQYGTPAVATVTLTAIGGNTFTGTAINETAIQGWFTGGSPTAAITGTPGATLVFTLTYTVADTTAPALSAGNVSNLSTAAGTTATLKFTSDEAGTYYYVVLASTDPTPTNTAVRAASSGIHDSDTALAAENTISVTGLTADSTYTAYIVVEDAAGNLSAVLLINGVDPVVPPLPKILNVSLGTNPSVADVTAAVSAQLAGQTSTSGWEVKISGVTLPNANLYQGITDAISSGDINLDLSGCVGTSITYVTGLSPTIRNRFVSVTLPTSVTTITDGSSYATAAFSNFTKLTSVTAPGVISLGKYTFFQCYDLTEVSLPEATTLGDYVFATCTSLTEVSLPAATTLGNYVFSQCTNLTEVSLPAAITLGDNVFVNSFYITEVSLPAATTLGNRVFFGCTNLTEVILPEATTFGTYTFYQCTSLETITWGVTTPTIGTNTFTSTGTTKAITINVPSTSETAYNTWLTTAATNLAIPSGKTVTIAALP